MNVEIELKRETLDPKFTLGQLYVNNVHFAFTCEDTDRQLENFPERKIHGQTAIPRGRYRVTCSQSKRFGRLLPILQDVPGFSGIRIHGGNTAADTEGCILLGRVRTDTGVSGCSERIESIIKTIIETESKGSEVWLTVK